MNIRFSFSRPRLLEQLASRAKDTRSILKRWVGFLRKESKEAFDRLGGPPLAESTLERLQETRRSNITAAGNIRADYARQLNYKLRRSPNARAELKRLVNGGSSSYSLLAGHENEAGAKVVERLRKKLEKQRTTGKRQGGDKRRSEGHKLLGRLRNALEGGIDGASAFVRNRGPGSKAHNEGGKVGHGAVLPARTTLQITPESARVLAQIVLEHLLGR
jgi:phage gpG-like protein